MSTVHTSTSDPLRIDWVPAPGAPGIIGMTLCPGKKDAGLFSGLWDRDLRADLDTIRRWGAAALVTLVEEDELHLLKVPELPQLAPAFGLQWLHLPIRDVDVPDNRFAELWHEAGPCLHRLLDEGQRIVLHCKGGLGRTGMVAAILLVERGMEPHLAVRMVRAARPGTVETGRQERFVMDMQSSADIGAERSTDYRETRGYAH